MASNNKRKINTSPLDSIGIDMGFLTADPAECLDDDSLTIHYLSAQLIRPDAAQPRRVLPEHIYCEFHGESLTPAGVHQLLQSGTNPSGASARGTTTTTTTYNRRSCLPMVYFNQLIQLLSRSRPSDSSRRG